MTRRGATFARWSLAALALGSLSACAQGAEGTFPTGFPPGPTTPATSGPSDTTGGGGGDCCIGNGSPGCSDASIESCVCAQSPGCCEGEWTSSCASMVDALGCGQCGGGGQDSGIDPDDTGPPSGQDCCVGGPAPGCNDPAVEACVCAEIGFCCEDEWAKVCGSAVEALGCGHCAGAGDTGEPPPPPGGSTDGGGDSGGPPPPPPPSGGCCEVQMTPGCTDAAVQDCVCMQDMYCCDTEWDQVCVDNVAMFGCGDCGGVMPPPGVSPCCEAQAGPGCGDPLIEACVCLVDDFCCTTQWDAVCAIFVDLFFCGSC